MIKLPSVATQPDAFNGSITDTVSDRPMGVVSLLALSAWCGLIAGLLEVATIVARKHFFDANRLHKLSRHFLWLTPVSNVSVFLALGILGCVVVLVWPHRGRWLVKRALCALLFLPPFLVALPRIYGLAWFVVTIGLAMRFVPIIEHNVPGFRRFVVGSFAAAMACVIMLGGSVWLGDRSRQASERARPLPPPGSPNVLLIVLDTVAAGHLGTHGYNRATSTTLTGLAQRGIRFDSARAASSWTLPSHAIMFTGRWLHELSVGWLTPLDQKYPTLAEYLGERGYATAGFVANTFYCGASSGLARGFTKYQDFIFPELTALKSSVLVSRALEGFQVLVFLAEDALEYTGALPHVQRLWKALDTDRKGAQEVTSEFCDWLSDRSPSDRPFFAFLNYFDAHYPYQLQPGRLHRFGIEPDDDYHRTLIQHWLEFDKTTLSPDGIAFAATAYDDCIADLDEQLGMLVDELDRCGISENTWLFITADHGESFGEHPGVFVHGGSLYDTEVHVPLVIIPPGNLVRGKIVNEPVSLRDLASTVVEATGAATDAPFPGISLSRFWTDHSPSLPTNKPASADVLAEVVPNNPGQLDYWGSPDGRPPLGALKDAEWSYIRRDEDVHEELYHLREDAKELRDRAGDSAAQTILRQMRARLDLLTGGPLVRQRFNR